MTQVATAAGDLRQKGTERESFRDFWIDAWRPSSAVGSYRMTRIEGEVPREINGTLYRNGPSQQVLPTRGYQALHLFDGDAMVHAFRFDDGRVDYTGRFVESATHRIEQSCGRLIASLVGEVVAAEERSDEVPIRQQHNTNIVFHGGKLMAMVENAWPFQLDPRDLSPMGPVDFDGKMLGLSTTAHPKIDGRTGEMIIHGYQPFEPYVVYYELDAGGACRVAEPIEVPYAAMMHDLAITEHYAVLPVGAITIDGSRLLSGEACFADCLAWEPEKGLRFAVRRRGAGGAVQWFQAPEPGFLFHPGNAYESDGKIYMDACTYEDGARLIDGLRTFRRGEGMGLRAFPYLYELDLTSGSCTARKLDDRGTEFPRIDDRRVGYRNRFGYAWRQEYQRQPPRVSTLVKYDREGGPSAAHDFGPWQWPGEPVFVPRVGDAGEDDGFVLSLVYDGNGDASYLAVLDARNMTAPALAKIHLEHRVPMGFHGNFRAAQP